MELKIFDKKKIKIRRLCRKDTKRVKEFQEYINSLIEEGVKILLNKKLTFKEEKRWLEDTFKQVKKHRKVSIVAEHSNRIIGNTGIDLDRGRKSHIGNFGISIRKGYRGIDIGKFLMEEIIKLAKKELKPKPKIIRLSVYSNNKPAINLYKKYGFKKVAVIPKQIQYKEKLINEVIMLRYL